MPNWVVNKIELMGNDEENAKILNFIKGDRKNGDGDIERDNSYAELYIHRRFGRKRI